AYNGEHHNVGPLQISEASEAEIRTPMVIETSSGKYLGIHEAAIFNFAPFNLRPDSGKYSLQFTDTPMKSALPFSSSWRTFIIGDEPGDLVESDLLVNLNPPCKIAETSWIQPGKSVWDWRVWGYEAPDGFVYGLNTESHLRFIDFASENNIQYLLIDADWYGSEFDENSDPSQSRSGVDIEKTMAYAKERDVGIILYLNDVGAKKFGLERVLKQFADWGASGVKYGFMQGSGAEKVRHTRRVVELCAKYHLMVDFHDNPVPPGGDRRTWPNLVTREFGHAQTDAKRSYQPVTAVTAPFVNMIAGPLDLTNGWFDLNNAHSREKVFEEIPGTVVAEVAKLIVIYTGLMVLPDSPEAYLDKEDLFACIRQMPPMFDSFDVLDGKIGEYISVARRSGDEWFIGSLTNEDSRTLSVHFDFLPENGKYTATLYEDSEDSHFLQNKESYRIRQMEVDSSTVLDINLAAGGGHAMYLQPVRK
ncbi:MAG: alpha-glucosidase, partial [Candidatus Marinimicrobia bacterium]|nr:alpha-glucosidase [Candidatus Neomarinimicrobiota bacterium]